MFLWSLLQAASWVQALGHLWRAHGSHPGIWAGYISPYFCHFVLLKK